MLILEGVDFGPLVPEHLSEMIAGAILFLLIWYVAAKKVVPVFEKTYAERTAEITGGIEKAESAQAEAAAALAEYQAQLATAREEAGRIREEARTQAVTLAAEIREQAQADSARLLASAKAQIEGRAGAGDQPAPLRGGRPGHRTRRTDRRGVPRGRRACPPQRGALHRRA